MIKSLLFILTLFSQVFSGLDAQEIEDLYMGARKGHTDSLSSLQKKVSEGNAYAQAYMSSLVGNGFCGLKRDHRQSKFYAEKAFSFIKEQADRGEPYALSRLATFYEFGRGVSKDHKEAFRLHKLAAETNKLSAYSLGRMYEKGRGVDQDKDKALEVYEACGHPLALYHAGEIYHASKNFEKAREQFEKAASEGLPEAYSSLGVLYRYGQGVEADYVKAYELYKQADTFHDRTSWAGLMEIKGRAMLLYSQAQELENSDDKESSWEEIIRLYTLAARLDNQKAQTALQRLKKD